MNLSQVEHILGLTLQALEKTSVPNYIVGPVNLDRLRI